MKETAKHIAWKELERQQEEYDKKHPKRFSYPKGSLEEAVDKAVDTLKS